MKQYKVIVGEGKMAEDELPADLPKTLYDWWYDLSEVPGGVGCRFGPKIYDMNSDDYIE